MSIIRREGPANPARYTRDPFALARELFNLDPYGEGRQTATFNPAFEVKETAEHFAIRADMPAVKDEDVDVSMHNGVLSITGRRAAEERKEGETYYLYERQYGSFTRSFALPDTADAERVEARLADGVLSVNVAKRVEAKPRKITIKK